MDYKIKCSTCGKQTNDKAMHFYLENGLTKIMWACSKLCHSKFSKSKGFS